jgi:hypothetical protein
MTRTKLKSSLISLPVVSFSTNPSTDNHPSVSMHSWITTGIKNPVQQAVPELLFDHPSPFNATLAHNQLRNSLENLNLAVEMVESSIKNTDVTIYLSVIKRSTIRINNLVSQFIVHEQAQEVHTS